MNISWQLFGVFGELGRDFDVFLVERIEDLNVADRILVVLQGNGEVSLLLDSRHADPRSRTRCPANGGSSPYGVLQCLRRCILPKDEWLARFPDIKGEWPAHGIMELIAVDNGMDLHSDALEAACQEMGIQILFCGSKTPQHKGAIERFFRTMNTLTAH